MAAADPRQGALQQSMSALGAGEIVNRGDLLPFGQDAQGNTDFAIPGTALSLYNSFMFPSRLTEDHGELWMTEDGPVYEDGTTPPTNEDAVAAAFDVFGVGMGASIATGLNKGLGIFGGRNAATADIEALTRAEAMSAQGTPAALILRDTGWFKGPDDKWRFEIDDSGYNYHGSEHISSTPRDDALYGPDGAGQASDFITHDALFAAYPELAPSEFNVYQMGPNIRGAYYPSAAPKTHRIDVTESLNDKSGPLHELQHAVQDIEGFAPGGNPATASDDLIAQAKERKASLQDQIELAARYGDNIDLRISETRRLRAERAELMKFISEASSPEARYRAYRQLYGEVEARNVQERMSMTPEERLAKRPWETMDIPEENWIVRPPDGGPSLSIDDIEILDAARVADDLPMDEVSRMAKRDRIAALRAEANANRAGESVDDYAGIHRPPMRGSGAPAHDLTGGGAVYPDDVYSPNAVQYYGTGNPAMDQETVEILNSLKGNPDGMVSIYRAVPSDASGAEISAGDWVTVNRNYAIDHGEGTLRGDYSIIERKVPARDIYTNGDSIHEFGFDPRNIKAEASQ